MRGNLYTCWLENGGAIDLQLDFEGALPGFVWVAWAYENYESKEGDNYYLSEKERASNPWIEALEGMGDAWKQVHASKFAVITGPHSPAEDLEYVH